MQNNPYVVLGIREGADRAEIDAAYEKLKKEYTDKMFIQGDEGAEAAKKLTEIKQAYEALTVTENKSQENYGYKAQEETRTFADVEALIKSGNIDEAQRVLDNISDRSGEWHYLQSVIFYRKNRIAESKEQLEMAVKSDPSNVKYTDALNKMNNLGANGFYGNGNYYDPHMRYGNGYGNGYGNNPNGTRGNMCYSGTGAEENCCMWYLCTSCCCNCMSSGC